jgi:hypothetical protein
LLGPGVDPGPVLFVDSQEVPSGTAERWDGQMTKYMILLYGDAQQWDAMTAEQREAHAAAHEAFTAKAGSAIVGGEELEPATIATTLRADGAGRVTTTDGPFLETKEALGGFYLLEADDIDTVIALASLLPEARDGHSGVEIRPVVDHG